METKKYFVFACLLVVVTDALSKREEKATTTPLLDLNKFKQNMDDFRLCVDKHLSNVVGEIPENHLQPILGVIGEQVDRLAKAWDVLTAPKSSTSPDDE